MSTHELIEFEQVMDALGGNGPVGDLTGAKASTVSMWRKSQSFPTNTYLLMTEALRARGFQAPASLWGMKQPDEQESAA